MLRTGTYNFSLPLSVCTKMWTDLLQSPLIPLLVLHLAWSTAGPIPGQQCGLYKALEHCDMPCCPPNAIQEAANSDGHFV